VLFPGHQHPALERGEITVALRRWKRPSVRAGGTLRTPVGVLAIDEVERITAEQVTDDDARRAGHPDRASALAAVDGFDGDLFRVRFHRAGDDPRTLLAATPPDDQELGELLAELDRIDRRSRRGAWTRQVLELIETDPETRAPDLAARVGRDTQPFKRDVRRLKELGLTVSYPVGYRLSVRGRAVVDALRGR
jgi:hypothetical protein